jgi:hypothetical protein
MQGGDKNLQPSYFLIEIINQHLIWNEFETFLFIAVSKSLTLQY